MANFLMWNGIWNLSGVDKNVTSVSLNDEGKLSNDTSEALNRNSVCLTEKNSINTVKGEREGVICITNNVIIIMSCCLSCCASLTCGLCTSTASCISQKSARIGYCFLFGASLIVSWILREVGAPLLEKLPCMFHFLSKAFNFHHNFPLGCLCSSWVKYD